MKRQISASARKQTENKTVSSCPKADSSKHSLLEDEMNVMLAILYAPEGQKPLSIARVYDRALLSAVAERAIREAEMSANNLTDDDPTLAAVQLEEANKLRRVLGLLLPAGAVSHQSAVMQFQRSENRSQS